MDRTPGMQQEEEQWVCMSAGDESRVNSRVSQRVIIRLKVLGINQIFFTSQKTELSGNDAELSGKSHEAIWSLLKGNWCQN